MILADTSAWIEYFSGRQSDIKERIEALIKDNNQICICGIVIQEILQGIKDDKTYKYLRDRLLAFPYIDTDLDTYLIASFIYRKLRRKGFSAPTIDLLI
ncbi:MAG: PIN domain nuclease, partial [Candidatus Margulisiibacteriota bacterium]